MPGFYRAAYYTLLVYGSLLGGLMISVVLMLYRASKAIILIYHPKQDAHFLFRTKQEKEESKQEKKSREEQQ